MIGEVAVWASVSEVLYQYAWSLDREDWETFESVFGDYARMDFLGDRGLVEGPHAIALCLQEIRRPLDRTQHVIHNVRVQSTEHSARVTAAYEAHHVARDRAPEPFTVGGFYHVTLLQQGERWLIERMVPEVVWTRGDSAVLGAAGELANGESRAAR